MGMGKKPDISYIAEPLRPLAVPIADLVPDAANARTHSERNLETIRNSLKRWGQRLPIVVQRDGMIVRAGNGRLEAAKSLGWSHLAALIVDDSSAEAVAFAIADNRTAELAGWDDETLASLLQSLDEEDRVDAGFDDGELADLLASLSPEVEVTEDDVPEPPADPVTRAGDLWSLGAHRVLCGDSTVVGDVDRLMDGASAAAVMTDPPYGVEYVGKTKDALVIQNDGADGLEALLGAAFDNAIRVCLPGGVWYVAAPAGPQFLDFAKQLARLGVWRQTLTWVKDSMVRGRSDYHYKHEAVFYGWRPGQAHREPPDRKQTTVWEIPRPKASREHPTMKPVALYAKMMQNSTTVGSVVYEPFGGSGTTLIAAEQLGRTCYGIEISPAYVDVIVRRWEKFTGKKATRVDAEGNPAEPMPDEVESGV